MKDLGIIILIVSAIIYGSLSARHFYEELYVSYQETLENLVNHIEEDPCKDDTIALIEKDWLQKEKVLIILQDHALIDELEEYLYECFHYYRFNQKEELVMAKNKALSVLEDVVKREEVLLVDIL